MGSVDLVDRRGGPVGLRRRLVAGMSGGKLPYPVDLYPGCPCLACDSKTWPESLSGFRFARMTLCPTCGSKRCPAASDHTKWECNNSNDTNQTARPKVTTVPAQAPQADETLAGEVAAAIGGIDGDECADLTPRAQDACRRAARAALDLLATHVRTIRAEREDGEPYCPVSGVNRQPVTAADCSACSGSCPHVWLVDIRADAEQAAARALVEAADALGPGPKMRVLVERESCDWWTEKPVATWLRERAERLS